MYRYHSRSLRKIRCELVDINKIVISDRAVSVATGNKPQGRSQCYVCTTPHHTQQVCTAARARAVLFDRAEIYLNYIPYFNSMRRCTLRVEKLTSNC